MKPITYTKEIKNKAGVFVKPLYIRRFALSEWRLIEELAAKEDLKTVGAVLKFALQKATGRS